MVNGGAPWNNTLTITKDKITKKYKKNALIPFMRELYVYLLAKQKKLNYIPKLINYDIEKKILVIENVGISIYDLCKKTKCNKDDFLPGIKEIYHKLIDLGIYHNDIHYKNILYNEKKDQLYLVDFEWSGPVLKNKDYENLLKKMKKIKGNKNTKKNSKNYRVRTKKVKRSSRL